jgi:hypothetical protein
MLARIVDLIGKFSNALTLGRAETLRDPRIENRDSILWAADVTNHDVTSYEKTRIVFRSGFLKYYPAGAV